MVLRCVALALLTAQFTLAATLSVREADDSLDLSATGHSPQAHSKPTLGRVLLYVTTALSRQHLTYLECQPEFLGKTTTLRHADVFMYVTESTPSSDAARQNYSQQLDKWTSGRKTIFYDTRNPGHEKGAKLASHMGFSSGWFDGYDWVIRINPDVVFYDERPMLKLMEDPTISGLFVLCRPYQTHTDFYAVRPEHVEKNAFANWASYENAEKQAYKAFKPIYKNKSYAELIDRGGNRTRNAYCRVDGGGGGVHHGTESCAQYMSKNPWARAEEEVVWRVAS